MIFRVEHTIEYRYSRDVFLEPHTIRLRPRNDPAQRELSFALTVEPEPMTLTNALDAEGDSVSYAFFGGTTDRLRIRTRLEAETLRANPFDYLFLDDAQRRLPMRYDDPNRFEPSVLYPSNEAMPEVDALVQDAVDASAGDTAGFLSDLVGRIYDNIEVEVRDEGEPHPPAETWARRRGACRDLTVLFNECCRRQGLAARFVSGYQIGDPDAEERHLHAWSEVYLPGGGWRGFDPTHGLAVADEHLALTSAAAPSDAAPTVGRFRGTGVTSEMHVELKIQTRAAP